MNIDGEKRFVMRYRIVNDAGEAVDLKFVYDYGASVFSRRGYLLMIFHPVGAL